MNPHGNNPRLNPSAPVWLTLLEENNGVIPAWEARKWNNNPLLIDDLIIAIAGIQHRNRFPAVTRPVWKSRRIYRPLGIERNVCNRIA